jgi:hypothetical protein
VIITTNVCICFRMRYNYVMVIHKFIFTAEVNSFSSYCSNEILHNVTKEKTSFVLIVDFIIKYNSLICTLFILSMNFRLIELVTLLSCYIWNVSLEGNLQAYAQWTMGYWRIVDHSYWKFIDKINKVQIRELYLIIKSTINTKDVFSLVTLCRISFE